jgi:hypothetical protein
VIVVWRVYFSLPLSFIFKVWPGKSFWRSRYIVPWIVSPG